MNWPTTAASLLIGFENVSDRKSYGWKSRTQNQTRFTRFYSTCENDDPRNLSSWRNVLFIFNCMVYIKFHQWQIIFFVPFRFLLLYSEAPILSYLWIHFFFSFLFLNLVSSHQMNLHSERGERKKKSPSFTISIFIICAPEPSHLFSPFSLL